MQTAIGQGNTLVSPMHMTLITSAIANNGVLMKPYLIDKVVNANGDTIKTTEPTTYKRLMTGNEAAILGKLMKGVVESGTASALNGRGSTAAGKDWARFCRIRRKWFQSFLVHRIFQRR